MPKRIGLCLAWLLLAACLPAASALAGGNVVINNQTNRTFYPAIAYKLENGAYQVFRCRGCPGKGVLVLNAQDNNDGTAWRLLVLLHGSACDHLLKHGNTVTPGAYPDKPIQPPCEVSIKIKNNVLVLE